MKITFLSFCLLSILLLSCSKSTPTVNSNNAAERNLQFHFPYATIEKYMAPYDSVKKLNSFDLFQDWQLANPVKVELINDSLCKITNTMSDGLVGEEIIFLLNKDLKILDVKYEEFSDALDGSTTNISVENVILSLNQNPFQATKDLFGTYTLLLCYDYLPSTINPEVEDKAESYFRTFEAKFKYFPKVDHKKEAETIGK